MTIINPFTKKPLPEKDAEFVEQLREVRRNARAHARSGNPAKRAGAKAALSKTPKLIEAVYRKNVS